MPASTDVLLPDADRALCETALEAARGAYAPYSGYAVGVAVRSADGEVFTGANMENASYGLSVCAEVGALSAASRAGRRDIETIAVVGYLFHPAEDRTGVCTPCGRCRQLIAELADLGGRDIVVYCCNGDLSKIERRTLSELLPHRFGPADLGMRDRWAAMEKRLRG